MLSLKPGLIDKLQLLQKQVKMISTLIRNVIGVVRVHIAALVIQINVVNGTPGD